MVPSDRISDTTLKLQTPFSWAGTIVHLRHFYLPIWLITYLLKKIYFLIYVCECLVCAIYVHYACGLFWRRSEESPGSPELDGYRWLWATIYMMGLEPGSSAKAVDAGAGEVAQWSRAFAGFFFFLRFTFIILNYISMYVCAGMYVHVCAGAHGGRGIRSPVAGVTDTHEPCDTGAGNHWAIFQASFPFLLFNLRISCPLQWHRNPSRTGAVCSLYLMLPPQPSKSGTQWAFEK